jgi:Na+/melibiose symporter-like transporter
MGRRDSVLGLTSLFAAIYFVQSVGDPTSGLIAQPVRSLLDRWGESPATIAAFMGLMALPWALKPLLALLSDFVPLFGSRRRNYLLVATATAAIGLMLAYFVPLSAGERWWLLTLLIVPTIGIAFTDVLADALMIEVGKPRGLTGTLQSAQWFAAYSALLLSGVVGGWLTASDRHELAFLICAALWAGSLVLTLAFVREPRQAASKTDRSTTAAALRGAFAIPGLVTIGIVSFLWDFNPLSYSVNYLHMTGTLGLSEQAFGNAFALFSAGAMAATAGYALYCRRVGTRVLLHAAIAAGVAGNVLYWWVTDAGSYYVVATLVGFAYMTGSLILLDLAARLAPVAVAATVFAVIMALASLGAAVGELAGGYLYDAALEHYGPTGAYRVTLVAGACAIASCWAWVPRLRRELALT